MPTPRIFRRFATWGAYPSERHALSAADAAVANADVHWIRGVNVDAAPEVVWEWVGQLRVAPYAYDWIDNFGRSSPGHLTPGLGTLSIGQHMLHAFRIVDVTPGTSVTIMLRTGSRRVVPYARSYVLTSTNAASCRLVVHIRARSPQRGLRRVGGAALGALSVVDFIMSRRELLNLKTFAERDVRLQNPRRGPTSATTPTLRPASHPIEEHR